MIGSRGRGRGAGDRGSSRGFRGVSRGFRGGSGGDRGGSRGSRGGSRGFRGGSGGERGSRGNFSGDNGHRGGRGFQAGMRGKFVKDNNSTNDQVDSENVNPKVGNEKGRGGHGLKRGSSGSTGRGGSVKNVTKVEDVTVKRVKKTGDVSHRYEVKAGLQLYITFKTSETDCKELTKLPGFHSFVKPEKMGNVRIVLFTDIESLESARDILNEHENVESVDLVGLRSAKKQGDSSENSYIYLRFQKSYDDIAVKKLDDKITEIVKLRDNSCKVKFESPEEADSALGRLKEKIDGVEGLKHADLTTAVKSARKAVAGIQHDHVVLRDVPKSVTFRDIAGPFPDAVAFRLFDKTFPASKYCHGTLRFKTPERATEILNKKEMMIAGKKVYIFPAYQEFFHDFPELGVVTETSEPQAGKAVVEKKKKASPAKKIKLETAKVEEKEDSSDEDEDEDDQDEEQEDIKKVVKGKQSSKESESEGEEDEEEESEDDDDDESSD